MKNNPKFEVIICIVNSGFSDEVMDAARKAGAKGGTVLRGRGTEAFYNSFIGATREEILDLNISDLIPNEDDGYETDNMPDSIKGPGIIANATFTTVYYHNAVLDAFDAFLKLTENA